MAPHATQQIKQREWSSRLESHSISILDYLSRRPSSTVREMAEDVEYWDRRQDTDYKYSTLMALEKKGFVSVTPETSVASTGALSYDVQRFEITEAGRFELEKYDVQEEIATVRRRGELIDTLRRLASELEEALPAARNKD